MKKRNVWTIMIPLIIIVAFTQCHNDDDDETSTTYSSTSCDSETGVAKIVCLAEAFKAALSSSQIATLQLDYTFSNAKTWSNLPAAM